MHAGYPMLEVEDAVARFLSGFHPLEPEAVPLLAALDRVLAEDVVADMDIPPLSNTAMDGYAVRCSDTGGARSTAPRKLRVMADLAAGSVLDRPLEPGAAVRIMTSAPIPAGAEAVIPFEEVESDGADILVFKRYPHGANIRRAGEDVRAGQVVLGKGTLLRPAAIGMLAALGRTQVLVPRRPRVALLSTGDEVIDATTTWQPGKIHDANGFSNAAQTLKYQ
jgi:molybdopterin molybdotransferase